MANKSDENNINHKDMVIGSQENNKTVDSNTKDTIGIGELKSHENKDEPGIAEDDFRGGVYLNEAMVKESSEASTEDVDSGK